ncbi:MAG: hypothetical protein JNJ83_10805 [Verrucomicrobiaceae bacterium]|nr:hypothetical protein [Verrucomicrobiaceae bacterium]
MPRSLLFLLALVAVIARAEDEYEQTPILYSQTAPKDAVTLLQRKVSEGKLKLPRGDAWGLLRVLQKEFNVPDATQVMVFSKTSKQNDLIGPATPRVVYFGDDAYLGYSVGGSIEVSVIDPELGPTFYLIDPRARDDRRLRFQRDQSCLSCHGGPFSPDVPGVIVRSVTPGPEGHPIMSQGSRVVDTTTAFEERWGGWYVTGKHGDAVHQGNVTAEENGESVIIDPKPGQNVSDLGQFFDTDPYPRKTSDVVALMVLEHQTSVQNILTKAAHSTRRALYMQQSLQKELGEPVSDVPTGTAARIVEHAVEDVLDAILFKDEAVLPKGGIEGGPEFQEAFAASARLSKSGRSLKDLQLLSRLFKYRCSYLVYGITFQNLPVQIKAPITKRLKEIMTADHAEERYSYLGDSERNHIHEILSETLSGY